MSWQAWLRFLGALPICFASPSASALASAQPEAKSEGTKVFYACHFHGGLERFGGTLEFDTMLNEDRSVYTENAQWNFHQSGQGRLEDAARKLVTSDGRKEGWISVGWSNDDLRGMSGSIREAVDNASVRITNYNWPNARKRELWRQSIIVRGREVLVIPDKNDRYLMAVSPVLASRFDSPSSPSLAVPISDLLAWGSGLPSVTIYDVLVESRKYRENSYPNDPAGRMRIIAESAVDVQLLNDVFKALVERHALWLKSIGSPSSNCKKTEFDPNQEIIVT
jgi:hypothetical protein